MRLQLARPDNDLISADRYNEIFTMHGTTMMFLFAVPVMEAMAIYLIPLMLGTRNMAFPRLNAFTYWMYLAGGMLLWVAFCSTSARTSAGSPIRRCPGPQYWPGKRADIWAQMITFTEVAALAVAVTLIATILKQRAPGMTLARMPLFVWAMLVASLMVIFAMPSVALASSMLISDRLVGTQFYNPSNMATRLLWQHLFWFFGHPEVYIIFLPATGFVSEIVATFCRRPVFGYPVVVLALVATGLLAFGLWVHHMFATGLPRLGYASTPPRAWPSRSRRASRSSAGSRRSGTGGRASQVPMLYVIGFIVTFVIGGLTGRDAGERAARPAAARHLLRRRPFPLRADRRRGVPAARAR